MTRSRSSVVVISSAVFVVGVVTAVEGAVTVVDGLKASEEEGSEVSVVVDSP